ncbi:hypothetical protein Bbelb_299540 [Branchiostoma belcheri]|nr:hypothetical protein Bbelb_299540 [Branchiostoma belcheri]
MFTGLGVLPSRPDYSVRPGILTGLVSGADCKQSATATGAGDTNVTGLHAGDSVAGPEDIAPPTRSLASLRRWECYPPARHINTRPGILTGLVSGADCEQSTTATGAGDATGLCAGEVRRWSRGHSSSNAVTFSP